MSACPGCGEEEGHGEGCPEAAVEEWQVQQTSSEEEAEPDADRDE